MRFRRLVAVILAFVVLFCSVFSVGAIEQPEQNNAYVFADGSIWDFMLFGCINGFLDEPYGDLVQDIAALACEEVCPNSEDGFHHAYRYNLDGVDVGFHEGAGRYGVATCHYCGYQFKLYSSDLAAAEDGFVSDLDSSQAQYSPAGFADVPLISPFLYLSPRGESGFYYESSAPVDAFYDRFVLKSLSAMDVNFTCYSNIGYGDPYPFVYVYTSSFVWSYPTANYDILFDFWPWDCWRSSNYIYIKYALYDLTTNTYYSDNLYNDYDHGPEFTQSLEEFVLTQGHEYRFCYMLPFSKFALAEDYRFAQGAYPSVQSVYTGSIDSVFGPSGTDSSSRSSSLMQAIHTYNTNNSYVDNSTNVNFFLVPSGEDPAEDTVVSPVIYDEETLVYTDPVTGTQYLTNGWTYDYLTRCYTLDMADESYKIGETVIDTIKLTYGDELLTVDHYSGGSLIRSDEYNYVMMSGSACAIDGHTYNVEITKEPTCTVAGERTYTCSVCGNQTVEDIPKTDHAYGNIEVLQDPTCTAPGITTFTCNTCQGQYKDTVAALGHDWQPTASTEESYVMPDNVCCPECFGNSFSFERTDLELKFGKNLFDLSQISVGQQSTSSGYVSEVGSDYFVLTVPSGASPVVVVGGVLRDIFPGLVSGKTYTLSFDTDTANVVNFYFYGEGKPWINGQSIIMTDELLSAKISFVYGSGNYCRISNIQIEEGTQATEYVPFDSEYVELIPPLYIFTCSGCSTVWTEEAEYQGATVTYTCTRCDATRTEAAGEEAGLFHSIGNLIADGITWATDKLTELVDNLSGINKTFNDYADSIRENVGQYPAFLGAIIALLPEDFMNVIWLGVIALVALAVWKKWFS